MGFMTAKRMRGLGLWDRYLTLWIFVAMTAGVCLGTLAPGAIRSLDTLSIGAMNVPIAIGLILMLYAPLAKVDYSKMPAVFSNKRLLALSLLFNWVICPLFMFALARLTLADRPSYMSGVIMIGLARCIAMVLVWNELAGGSGSYAAGLVAVNAVFQILLYAPLAWLFLEVLVPLTGVEIPAASFSMGQVAHSVLVYLGVPFAAGALTRFACIRFRSEEWFESRAVPRISKVTPAALIFTIVVVFSMKGGMIARLPLDVLRIAAPLVVYFCVTFFVSAWSAHRFGAGYPYMASVAFTATGNNFELAIAVAAASFGLASGEAFAAVVGPLIEVPSLILLVDASLALRRRWYGPEGAEEEDGVQGPVDIQGGAR